MFRNTTLIFIVVIFVSIASILVVCLLDKTTYIKNSEQIALETILKEVASDNQEHVYLLKNMLDKKKNLVWIEFYDTKSYLSCLWLGFVIIDLTFRKGEPELHNSFGDFFLVNTNTE